MSKREIPIDEPRENAANPETDTPAAESGAESGTEAQDQMAALEQENQRLRDQAIRAVADLENFRRRSVQEREQLTLFANERLLRALLPIIDDFQRSVESGEQNPDFESFFQGISMINGKLLKLLESQGVKKIETIGQPFSVDLHEALMRQPSEAPEDTVISEVEPGYKYGDRVLRHAKVIVSAGS